MIALVKIIFKGRKTMTNLQLLFKSFYDIAFVRNYAKNGKGTGVSLMCLLALIMTCAFSLSLYSKISPFLDNEKISISINEAFDKMPPLVIENGELVWEKDVVETFVFDKSLKMTVDTKNTVPSIKQMGTSVFYLTKTDLYVNNKGKIQSVSWAEVQESFDQNPVDLKSPEVRESAILLAKYILITAFVFGFLFSFLFFWLMNGILSSLTRTIASKIYNRFHNMDYYEIRRTASAAVTPMLLLITASQVVLGQPSFWIKAAVVITVGILLMDKFIPSNNEQVQPAETEENK